MAAAGRERQVRARLGPGIGADAQHAVGDEQAGEAHGVGGEEGPHPGGADPDGLGCEPPAHRLCRRFAHAEEIPRRRPGASPALTRRPARRMTTA